MYLAIGALLSISHLVLTSPLHELALGSAHQLHKRDWVLECREDVVPPVERNSFDSLGDLCKSYPHGFGLYCDAQGIPTHRLPTSLLSRTYGNSLAHVCLLYCQCQNLAPEAPVRVDEALDAHFQECSMSSSDPSTDHDSNGRAGESAGPPSSSTTCNRSGSSNQAYFERCECNEYWYGRPNNQDCHQALLRLPDHGIATQKLREFLPAGHPAQHPGAENPSVRAPIILTHGYCTVAALLPEGPGTQNSIMVDTLELNNAAEDLRGRCVQIEGIGGKFNQELSPEDRQIFHQLPPIVMFAPDSKWKEFLDLKYSCAVQAEGSAECKPIPGSSGRANPRTKHGAYSDWKYMGAIGNQGWTPQGKGRSHQCSGSCNNPTDCDINSDCLCAAPNRGIAVHSSWGRHTCMHVVGAAAAVAAAAISPNGCRGRCLLQEDGTLDIGRPLNATNATILSFDVSPNQINTTTSSDPSSPAPEIPPTVIGTEPSFQHSNDDSSSSSSTASFPSGPDDSPQPADNTTGPASNDTTTTITYINGIPTVSNETDDAQYINGSTSGTIPPEYIIFNDTAPDQVSPILSCPCNCTYVSAACCLSTIVFEDPSMQTPMDPLPANASVCCDPNSGFWLPKPSGECDRLAANFNADGFIGLGSVKWDNNASRRIGFPERGREGGNT